MFKGHFAANPTETGTRNQTTVTSVNNTNQTTVSTSSTTTPIPISSTVQINQSVSIQESSPSPSPNLRVTIVQGQSDANETNTESTLVALNETLDFSSTVPTMGTTVISVENKNETTVSTNNSITSTTPIPVSFALPTMQSESIQESSPTRVAIVQVQLDANETTDATTTVPLPNKTVDFSSTVPTIGTTVLQPEPSTTEGTTTETGLQESTTPSTTSHRVVRSTQVKHKPTTPVTTPRPNKTKSLEIEKKQAAVFPPRYESSLKNIPTIFSRVRHFSGCTQRKVFHFLL